MCDARRYEGIGAALARAVMGLTGANTLEQLGMDPRLRATARLAEVVAREPVDGSSRFGHEAVLAEAARVALGLSGFLEAWARLAMPAGGDERERESPRADVGGARSVAGIVVGALAEFGVSVCADAEEPVRRSRNHHIVRVRRHEKVTPEAT